MGKYDDLAKKIIERVGGRGNIAGLTHCATKLRFLLKDEAKADTRGLKTMPGVITVVQSSGQYQLVIGNHAPDVCETVSRLAGIVDFKEERGRERSVFGRFPEFFAGIFTPLVSVFCAMGVLKGIQGFLLHVGLYGETDAFYQFVQLLSDSLFYYLPIFIGATAARKFQINQFTGMIIGACFVYPFRFGVVERPYTVLPVIFAVWAASYMERFLKKILPDLLKLFLVPLITLLFTTILTRIVIETVYTGLTAIVMMAIDQTYAVSPFLSSFLAGAFWPFFVLLGLHGELVPMIPESLPDAMTGVFLPTVGFIASCAQAGAVFAVLLKTRDRRLQAISIPSVIAGLFGMAEPGIYGVALPEKKPFIISCIGSAAGGLVFIWLRDYGAQSGLSAPLAAAGAAFVLTWIITLVICKYPKEEKVEFPSVSPSLDGKKVIHSPLNGKFVPLIEVGDEVFSSGVLGDGIAIEPYDGVVYAPADCKVTTFFPTGHAIGLTTSEGVELLIHIGVDTVQLNGKYFKPLVKQGESLLEGQPMLQFDSRKIEQAGYDMTTSVIITNTPDWKRVDSTKATETTVGDALLVLV